MSQASERMASQGKGAQPKVLRRLGGNEAYQLAMYTLDQYRGTSISCRYNIPPPLVGLHARERLIRKVEAEVADTVLKHAVLQLGILDADSAQPKWVRLDSLNLRQHIEWRFLDGSVDFESVLQEVTTARLDATYPELEKRPGWNINHPHGDGSLNSPTKATQPESNLSILKFPESTPKLPPPIEKIMSFPIEFNRECNPNPYQADWAPIRTSPYKTRFRVFTVEHDILAIVLTACRLHRTTLTGLLHGLALVSLTSRLGPQTASGFTGMTTVDIRRFISLSPPGYPWLESPRTVSNYITIMNHEFNLLLVSEIRSKLPFKNADRSLPAQVVGLVWSTAASVRGEIVHKLEKGVKNNIISIFKFVLDWRTQMKQAARRPRQASWMITGLGMLDEKPNCCVTSPDELWSLERAQFALSAETTASALLISPMAIAGKRLCVGGSWQDCLFDASLGGGIMNDLHLWLTEIGSKPI
ncbi:hypothetical protein HD806DRAFT_552984 [Xylariaceae sp. AK1471]|nr:hypothetical protein HD806DRAFT_552984 [Xylariaceae sp. AK1471]